MHKYLTKRSFIIINIILFLIEVFLIYLMINTFLNNDVLSPQTISFYEYLKLTFQNNV